MLGKQAIKIDYMKEKQGLKPNVPEPGKQKKKSGPKNPNPLSCKKSKKQKQDPKEKPTLRGVEKTTQTKAKRKRVSIPAHVKSVLQQNS